jgi:glyoxylase-like metal-dependent hydrolase (beta-lactamase superfamily II)
MIKVKVFTFNLFSENTFILLDEETKEAAIVDPGMSSNEEEKILDEFISSNYLSINYLINTHCHIDHILGCKYIKEKYNPKYYVPENDLILIENAQQQAQMFDLTLEQPPHPDKFITEETELFLGKTKINFLFTPGHTAGEYCLYLEKEKICITGDVLFKEGIGRTDLWGGNYDVLIDSIETKLFTLPDDVMIYPGHGDVSTIGHEKQYNPFLV